MREQNDLAEMADYKHGQSWTRYPVDYNSLSLVAKLEYHQYRNDTLGLLLDESERIASKNTMVATMVATIVVVCSIASRFYL